jgi:NAD-dependent SIR2 family protein deacetylase
MAIIMGTSLDVLPAVIILALCHVDGWQVEELNDILENNLVRSWNGLSPSNLWSHSVGV